MNGSDYKQWLKHRDRANKLVQREKYGEAKRELERALKCLDRITGDSDLCRVVTYGEIAEYYIESGQMELAWEWLSRARAMFSRRGGKWQQGESAYCLYNEAKALTNLGRFEEALEKFRQASGIYERAFGSGHFYIAIVWAGISRVLRLQGKLEEAATLIRRSRQMLNDRADAEWNAIWALQEHAEIESASGRLEEAEGLFEEAIRRMRLYRAGGGRRLVQLHNRLVEVQGLRGRWGQAKETAWESVSIAEKHLAPSDEHRIAAKRQLLEIERHLADSVAVELLEDSIAEDSIDTLNLASRRWR